jgi:hypothetical protein
MWIGVIVAAILQAPVQATGTVDGVVTAHNGLLVVAGATIQAKKADGQVVAETTTGETGQFHLTLPAGRYRLRATHYTFAETETDVEVTAGLATTVTIDMPIGSFKESISVTPGMGVLPRALAKTSPAVEFSAQAVDDLPIGGDDTLTEVQRLVPGVVQTANGVSMKGGRANQSSLQLGRANVTDPYSGHSVFRLPWDAVQTVEILPNPYAVEFGRFSSGVTTIETRSGGNAWRGRANHFLPTFRTRRGKPWDILGVQRFAPQLSFRGPLAKDRVFLAQSLEYRFENSDLRSRDQSDVISQRGWNSFSRLDARAGGLLVTGSLSVSSQRTSAVNLDAFTPPNAAADQRQHFLNGFVSNARALTATSVLESTLQVNRYETEIEPRDRKWGAMNLAPQQNSGRYFAEETRQSHSYQWVESWTQAVQGRTGEHLIKAGIDVLHTSYDGHRTTAPLVFVFRPDGHLSRRLAYGKSSTQRVRSTDFALFVQDRWQPSPAWLFDVGGRVDRDGVLGTNNFTVRAGFVRAIGTGGGGAVRGGAGLFYERTPSVVGAFTQFETPTDVRFVGTSIPVWPEVPVPPILASDLQTPHSVIWSAGYSQRLSSSFWLDLNVLARHGTHEHIVEPRPGIGMVLSDEGRSNYREGEVSLRYSPRSTFEVQASYTASRARADLNGITEFFGAIPAPIIGPNQYAVAPGDTPHRLLARLRWAPGNVWRYGASLEWRTGFPYGALDAFYDPVFPRNGYRLPSVSRLDLGIDRRIRVKKSRAWIAVRVSNALNTADPSEVQRRLDSPDFGRLFNSRPRTVRLLLRFQ